MGSKVMVTVAWGVECLFGVESRVNEAQWDSLSVLEQQAYVRDVVSGKVIALDSADDNDDGEPDPEPEPETEEVVSLGEDEVVSEH